MFSAIAILFLRNRETQVSVVAKPENKGGRTCLAKGEGLWTKVLDEWREWTLEVERQREVEES